MDSVLRSAAALLLFIISSVRSEDQNLGCIYSWNLDQNGTTCSVYCPTSFHNKFNAYCNLIGLKSSSLNYDSSRQILSIPSGTSIGSFNEGATVPYCYNVTLNEGQYKITSDGYVQLSPLLMNIAPDLSVFPSDNLTICYPASPQLLQCDVIRIPLGAYEIVNQTQLKIFESNFTAILGDFFIDENKMAVTCADVVTNHMTFQKLTRCNVISVSHNDTRVNADGSLTLLQADFTIKNPIYSVNYSEFLLICVPLSTEFLNCPTLRKVSATFYVSLANLSVVNVYYGQTMFTPDNYYITIAGDVVTCISNTNGAMSFPFHVILSIFYISGILLMLTLIIRRDMFARTYQGLYLMLHILSLMGVCFVSGSRLFFTTFKAIPCFLVFGLNYFFVMATILWLNVMAYDSWSYFSNLLDRRRKDKDFKRCIIYNAVVWGLSSFLTLIALVLDLSGPPFDFSAPFRLNVMVPQFPFNYTMWNMCFFNKWITFNLYFSLPLIVFSVINIVFIVMTIRCIHQAGKGTELVNHRRQRQLFEVSVRLFNMMGFGWTVDCLSYLIGSSAASAFQVWYIIVAMGAESIQGCLIFIIYCATKQVWQTFLNSFRSPKKK